MTDSNQVFVRVRTKGGHDITDLFTRLLAVYSKEDALSWFNSPEPRLNHQRAADLIDAGRRDSVVAVIAMIEGGAS